jgi:hypothetical protein
VENVQCVELVGRIGDSARRGKLKSARKYGTLCQEPLFGVVEEVV